MESTYRYRIRLENRVPGDTPRVVFQVTDAKSNVSKLAVPGNGSVTHVVDAGDGPWTVSATLMENPSENGPSTTTAQVFVDSEDTVICSATQCGDHVVGKLSRQRMAADNATTSRPSLLDQASSWRTAVTAPAAARTLVFPMQVQMQSQWAWAAVTASVATYYQSPVNCTQCSLANWAFMQTSCCTSGSSSACNRPFSLRSSLAYIGHLNQMTVGALTLSTIMAEIDAGRPVLVSVNWTSGGSHCLAITGYDSQSGIIMVLDPWSGTTYIKLTDFPARYMSGGIWSYSYTTM